jgi:hypothetical protein
MEFIKLVRLFQSLQLRDVNLSAQVTEPFKTMVDYKECPTNWRWRDAFRTFQWGKVHGSLLRLISCYSLGCV